LSLKLKKEPSKTTSQNWFIQHKYPIAIIVIVLLAAFFRLFRLESLPPGLHPDEAANGLDIFRIQDGDIRPLYNTNGPRESLFFFLQGLFVFIFGNTILALRLAPALIGTSAVAVTYLLTKEWFSRQTALMAAFFIATAPWAVTMSRNGFRASMIPLMIPLTLWLFTKSMQKRRWYWYVLTGISFGAGFYTYLAFRLTPLIIIMVASFAVFKYKSRVKELIKPVLIMVLAATITLIPMLLFTLEHPEDVLGGRSSVSFTNPELNDGKPWQTLAETVGKTALMFNFYGDENFRHNLGGAPMLNGFVGILFILGLLISFRRIFDIRYLTLLSVFAVMLLPEILTAEGIPHGLRAIGVIPVVYILAAIGLKELVQRWRGVFPRNPVARGFMITLISLTLILSTVYNYQRYFVAWANAPATYEAYSEDSVAIATYVNELETNEPVYVVIDGYSNITLLYLTNNKSTYTRVESAELDNLGDVKSGTLIVAATQQQSVNSFLSSLSVNLIKEHESKDRAGVILFRVYEFKQEQP
jgi:4-amino-4-deoxy-L-arabinose transferase-like glycosyltransferase